MRHFISNLRELPLDEQPIHGARAEPRKRRVALGALVRLFVRLVVAPAAAPVVVLAAVFVVVVLLLVVAVGRVAVARRPAAVIAIFLAVRWRVGRRRARARGRRRRRRCGGGACGKRRRGGGGVHLGAEPLVERTLEEVR